MANRKRGRPPKRYQMENGVVDQDMIYLYAPEETIPKKQVNRFLRLCDEQLKEMNLDELTASDIDEVVQHNRTRMLKDYVIQVMVNPSVPSGIDPENLDQFTDLGLITQIEKLHKQMNSHQENLKVRRKDRYTGKVQGQQKSLTDLARELDENPQRLEDLKKKSKDEIRIYEKENTDTDPLDFINNMSRDESLS